jgi:hypothetical protein
MLSLEHHHHRARRPTMTIQIWLDLAILVLRILAAGAAG